MKFALALLLFCAILVCTFAGSKQSKHKKAKDHSLSTTRSPHHSLLSDLLHRSTRSPRHSSPHEPTRQPRSHSHSPTRSPRTKTRKRSKSHDPTRKSHHSSLHLPNVYDHPRQKNGFFVPKLASAAKTKLHPSELPAHHPHPQAQKIRGTFVSLSSALGHRTFRSSPFILDLINPQKDRTLTQHTADALKRIDGHIFHFKVLQLRSHGHNYNALKLVEHGDHSDQAYWLPQGGHIDIPAHPGKNDPKIILTAGFSGCALAADLMKDGHTLRFRHVQGGHEDAEYNNVHDHGFGLIGAMEYKNYGYHIDKKKHKYIEHITASAFVQYTGSEWVIKYQMIENTPLIRSAKFSKKGATIETIIPSENRVVGYGEVDLKIPKH